LNTTGEISDFYYLEITPAGWTFGLIWGVIFIWNGVGLVYCLTTIGRKNSYGEYIYQDPGLTPKWAFLALMCNLVGNVTWVFMWDRQFISPCISPIAIATFSLYVVIFFCARATKAHVEKTGSRDKEFWLVTILLHNALAFYATWLSIATLLNFAIMGAYDARSSDQSAACTVVLAVLLIEASTWFCFDMLKLDAYTRYIIAPYVILLLASAGSLDRNWKSGARNSVFTAVLMAVFCVFFVVKIFVTMWRHCRKSIADQMA
jgi:hypothetical protein